MEAKAPEPEKSCDVFWMEEEGSVAGPAQGTENTAKTQLGHRPFSSQCPTQFPSLRCSLVTLVKGLGKNWKRAKRTNY